MLTIDMISNTLGPLTYSYQGIKYTLPFFNVDMISEEGDNPIGLDHFNNEEYVLTFLSIKEHIP